ncbi:hypothetical protein HYALB_00004510 [Hymenoscyphus albidus]|uniref:Uncharacterized protein n=1 Tax=Hymenoscyphus albidus TaxID=595503 RepID=A0A9N9QCE5_9HELO|nr:hypothetical protein HYALB_00004510 [Hymenoscyphus albidus]
MAASNTRFWTEEGWNGSEEMIQKSMIICTRVAHKPRMKFVSRTAAETLVVAIQGVQSVIELTRRPFIGLLSLPAAYWISDEATYAEYHSQIGKALSDSGGYELYRIRPMEGAETYPNEQQMTYDSHPVNNWRGCMVRIFFFLIITGFSAAGIAFVLPLMPPEWTNVMSATNYVEVCFYTFVTIPMLGILMVYSFQNPRTTIIPCVQPLWYKIHTVLLFVFMLVYISIAALETRKSPCGSFTTLTGSAQCVDGEGVTSVSKEFDGVYFGYSNGSQTFVDLVPFDWWCKGSLGVQMAHIEMPQRHLANSSDWFSNLVGIPEFTANIEAYLPREGL